MKLRLIEDGNFASWLGGTFLLVGVGLVIFALDAKRFWPQARMFMFCIGFLLAALGGYSSKARALRIKPFDNSYNEARKTYEAGDEGRGPKS
ncbi:hypothetical protein [Paraburkholderia sp. JHI869]|uniref:hypothetical protein n=1 Tax=Paraburkholderia sp. JHI869 TaxID=3112959 RepID=UPI00317D12CA